MSAAGGVVARSFVFTATCSGCGGRLEVAEHERPGVNVRRCTGTCVDCGNRYRFTVTMIQEPASVRKRGGR